MFVAKWQCIVLAITFKIKNMANEVNVLHYCGDCINKVVDDSLPKGSYRCHLVAGIINTDIVHYDTDASDCVRSGRYRRMVEAYGSNTVVSVEGKGR